MKKQKLLLPLLISTAITPMVSTIASCSTSSYTVLLYAGEGKFGSKGRTLVLSGVGEKTKLSDIANYLEPTSTDMEFVGWTDEYGKYVSEDTEVTSDLILRANYDLPESTPESFDTDSWLTVLKVIDQGYVKFARAYCNYDGKDEEGAMFAIEQWMVTSEESFRQIRIRCNNSEILAYVHPIGLAYDTIYGTDQKAKFTFEFYDVIDACLYNNDDNVKNWYKESSDGTISQVFLRKYLNEDVYNYLPICVRKAIKTVDKKSPNIVLDTVSGIDITFSHSPEKLFPLSLFENNSWILLRDFNINKTFEPYWFHQYMTQIVPSSDYLPELFSKPIVGTYSDPFSNDGLICDYWTRMGSFSIVSEGEIMELRNAWAIYFDEFYNPSQVVLCPRAPSDIGIGLSPAFCI